MTISYTMPKYPRGYSITINNWTEEELATMLELYDSTKYCIIGFEKCPTTGTPHLQTYAYWPNGKSWNTIEKKLKRSHIEIAKGTALQNRTYCSKDGDFYEYGEIPKQGERSDLQSFKDAILSGMSEEDLCEQFTDSMARYDRFYKRIKNIDLKKKCKSIIKPEVIVITGPTGCGKTHTVYADNDIDNIYKMECGDGSSGSIFWDDYNGEDIILIDDFHNNFKLDYMLRLLDKYPMKLNVKGGHTYKVAKKIYITSNIDPEYWYPNCPDVHRAALQRRITTHIKMSQPE